MTNFLIPFEVSTHSRPKAAGLGLGQILQLHQGFNTQPPEGGWRWVARVNANVFLFQHTAARRRLDVQGVLYWIDCLFQHTAARRRLARTTLRKYIYTTFQHTAARRRLVKFLFSEDKFKRVSTHSRPKAAGLGMNPVDFAKQFQHTAARRRLERPQLENVQFFRVSTHSRPKAAGVCGWKGQFARFVSTHSRPKAAGYNQMLQNGVMSRFQHTAARRRLDPCWFKRCFESIGFNTQPPEGGWIPPNPVQQYGHCCFNTQPPEGGWPMPESQKVWSGSFNTQPPEGGWGRAGLKLMREFVSTHSRPKAAGGWETVGTTMATVSTHSRPKAAGCSFSGENLGEIVSTHSRPKAAGSALS